MRGEVTEMKFFKTIIDGYIASIGTGSGLTEITEEEYSEILAVIQQKPQDTDTIGYRLKSDLTWESYEHEPSPEADPDAEEALAILLGGAV